MGADMLLALARHPHFSPEGSIAWGLAANTDSFELNSTTATHERHRIRLRHIYRLRIEKWLKSLSEDELDEFGEERLDWWAEKPSTLEAKHLDVTHQLMLDLESTVLTNNREVTEVTLGSTTWLCSGGLSSGDAPTDAYTPLQRLDASGILDAAITGPEYKAGSDYEISIRTKEQS